MSDKRYFVFLFLFATSLFAQKELPDQGKINQKNYYEEIDFEMVNEKILFPVVINGKTYRFLLDTGAPNLISKRVLNELNITGTDTIDAHDSNNQKSSIATAVIPSITLGNLTLENNKVLVSDLDNHFILKCYQFDGFIGSTFFQNSILKISLKDKKIIVTDDVKKLNLKVKPTKIKLVGKQNAPYVKIHFLGNHDEKATEEVLLDTGMDGFYEISNRAYAIFSKEKIFEELSRANGSTGIGLFGSAPVKEQVLLKSKSLSINDVSFENLITNTTDDNNSRIGLDLLKYGDIVIDFMNKKFYFEAAEKKVSFTKPPPVFSPTIINNKYSVGFVWDKKYTNQLTYGDEIIQIGNYKLAEMDFCDIITKKKQLKNIPSYEMTVKTKDHKIIVLNIEN